MSMALNKVHCFFEQSGTFKNEFIKLGIEAEDYDILNDFNETDNIIDLFGEIEKAYDGEKSIFDSIKKDDLIMAFFPCTRFEAQIEMHFRGTAKQLKGWSLLEKLEYDLKLHEELHQLYQVITKMAIVCLRGGYKMIIENPYSTTHYLVKYWSIPATMIDNNRLLRGDYYEKPTQYWFLNLKPSDNLLFEAQVVNPRRLVHRMSSAKERSLISPEYANRFIREFVIEGRKENE